MGTVTFENDLAMVGGTNDLHVNPKTFQEAQYHQNLEERELWREVIRKEFRDMMSKGMW